MRVLFIQQDHMSPTGPVGEAFADHGFDVQEFMVVPEEHFRRPSVGVTFPDPLAFDAIVPMGAAWSVYDHDRPELTPQMLDGWLDNVGGEHAVALGTDPDQLVAETAARSAEARARARRLVAAFLALGGSA
jgi:hypothetical protein